MIDPVIRPGNGLMFVALQSAEGAPATPSATTDVIAVETDSVDYNGPYKSEQTNEATGSFAAGAPLVVGQPATITFRARIRGAAAAYTSSVKPPLHAALSACGMLGLFTSAVAAAALTAGTVSQATLGTGFGASAQMYRGMPLVLAGAPAIGRLPLISNYTAGKIAQLTDKYGTALSTTNTAALPANWTYAPTSPPDAASRAAMHPCATIQWNEDGSLHTWTDCRGTVDLDGNSARPGFATFNFTGVYQGRTDVSLPANPIFAGQSAPLLLQGVGTAPAFQVDRRGLAISKWSIKNGGQIGTPDDPNSAIGFGAGQISDRMIMLEIDPLLTQVATRDAMADIAAFSQYTAAIQLGSVAGNRVSILLPTVQPIETAPGLRDKLRSETLRYQSLNPGDDSVGRDSDLVLCFS